MAQRDFQRYDIAMFFGVPPHMIGATEKTTSWGSGIEQLNIGFVQYTLNDWFVTWQETIKRDLMNERDRDTADTSVICHAPVVTKTAQTYWNRDWDWTITKDFDATYNLFAGGSVMHDYKVNVDPTYTDNFWGV